MKKLSILFATVLMLIASIVFCSCDEGYKNLKIQCSVEEIKLVLDDENLSKQDMIFEVSGVKSWGDVSIVSNPAGMVKVATAIEGQQCFVRVEALQPTGVGSSLVVTHLGSGKILSIPLTIGRKLQTIQSSGKAFVIQSPDFSKIEAGENNVKTIEVEIPTKQLLTCYPENYTDTIVWQPKNVNTVSGVQIVSYDIDGNRLSQTFQASTQDPHAVKCQGVSSAVRTIIEIKENYDINNGIIELQPISILDNQAILHKDVVVEVNICDLLEKEDINIVSTTHGDKNNILKDLVLISNPDANNPRTVTGLNGYDFYSTAIIDLMLLDENANANQPVFKSLNDGSQNFSEFYDINISTNIDALTLENVEFGKVRVIATSTCVGSGEIKVDFVPKDCVGDIKGFSINIPCLVGERATSFSATNSGIKIEAEKENDYTFNSITPLQDSNSLGQAFKFDVLSTNVLSAMDKYQIKINKNLLYINPSVIDTATYTSQYIRSIGGNVINLTSILENKYEYQISILKDGRQVYFYEQDDYFVSEPFETKHTIYMKWIRTNGKALGDTVFGISVTNYYDNSFDIVDNEFDETLITHNFIFNRQRTVESISYLPVMIKTNNELNKEDAIDAGSDWQFYFETSMLDNNGVFYGIQITEVLGLNSTSLTEAELSNINLSININSTALGLGLFVYNLQGVYDVTTQTKEGVYENSCIFNFDNGNMGYENVVIIGKTGLSNVEYGDYTLTISQGTHTLATRDIRIYKQLEEGDVDVSIPTADFDGELLQYEYVSMTERPSNWNKVYVDYYEYDGGKYVPASATWKDNKSYYIKRNIPVLDISKTYILSTSNQYLINLLIANDDFVSLSGQNIEASVVANEGHTLSNSYIANLLHKDYNGNDIIKTGEVGSFNTSTNKQNYIKLTYTVRANTYDYYKLNKNEEIEVSKVIYVYVYEPISSAIFDKTMLYKYDYSSIPNTQLKQEYGKQTLSVVLNGGSQTAFNYVNIKWTNAGDGISDWSLNQDNSATFTFANKNANISAEGKIIATLTQFGVQYPIYCGYQVSKPILSEQVILNTVINSYQSGEGYINLKVGESIKIDAISRSSKGNVSLPGFSYVVCSSSGYAIDGVASIDRDGLLTSITAGRAKLIIIAKDVIKGNLSNVAYYFDTKSYLANKDAYLIIDILVSDGSENYPYLIANGRDFKAISNDYYYWDIDKNGNEIKVNANGDTSKINNYYYALVENINLDGVSVNFKAFEGNITSFQENENSNNKFNIYGVMLDENNPNLFTVLNKNSDGLPVLKNINIHVDINYKATKVNQDKILIGLIGTNGALIEDVTITISGSVNANNLANVYTVGSMAALNLETIKIVDKTLVGVQGDIKVFNSGSSTVVLGGMVGENQGIIQGSHVSNLTNEIGEDVEYEVYYDNQGATADIELQVTSVSNLDNSAIGGVVGLNSYGIINDVYAMGKVLGVDDSNNFTINNVGGLIGKNAGNRIITANIVSRQINDQEALKSVTYTNDNFQIVNSYSSAIVKGNNNVGGVVGYDLRGSYKKVYYEIYKTQTSIEGNNNIGGLIGQAQDSNLYYCYANSFALGYKTSVDTYDVSGKTNVGGLIGLAVSSRNRNFATLNYNYSAMNITNSLASVSLTGNYNVCGLIGRLNNFGAIYTAFFYGVIDPNISTLNTDPIVRIYKDNAVITNVPYNNIYAIVNGEDRVQASFYLGPTNSSNGVVNGFGINSEYNNEKPYIVYEDESGNQSNLVSIVPTQIQLNKAFETYYNNDKMYKLNALGDYVLVDGSYVVYNPTIHTNSNITRYSLMAELINTGDAEDSLSDYRKKAIVLYYYQLSDMSGENSLTDLHYLNTVDMHNIVSSEGIIILPNTLKRFNVRTSDSSIVSVLSGGRLLLNNEGQVTITLISTLNPSVSASFVVIVRTKVLKFNLYSNANLREEYNIKDTTINIVKNSSKIIYPNYNSTIKVYNREYEYKSASNVLIEFRISYNNVLQDGNIRDYIRLNDDYYDSDNDVYIIPHGTPITITVDEYIDGLFTVVAKPYIVATYKNGDYSNDVYIELSNYFTTSFNVATKQGASAINSNKTQLDMMPVDEASQLDIKLTTDVKVGDLYFEIEAIGDKWEVENIDNPNEKIQFIEMLDILYNSNKQPLTFNTNQDGVKVLSKGTIDISGVPLTQLETGIFVQSLNLSVKLNEKSYYVNVPFKLQLTLYVLNGSRQIATTIYINVEPQAITSVVSRNYRMQDGETILNINKAYQSQVIRPGSTNIITVDIAPNIAVYDYIDIKDLTPQDKVLFQQVDEDLELLENMDTWTDQGIKLKKYNEKTSKLYLIAKLPEKATANISHTIQINVYDKDGNVISTTYLNLEAVMYPTVVMTYNYPNGDTVVVDTRLGNAQQYAYDRANLAMGVEAGISIETYNIDEGSLNHEIAVMYDGNDYTQQYADILSLEYIYGKYVLQFKSDKQDAWESLLGRQVHLSFTASKSLNGITETCKATIIFDIKRIVIHGISMSHTNSKRDLYGNWDEEFTTQFYFDKNDISYYYKGYWNVNYTIDNTDTSNMVNGDLKQDLDIIHNILLQFNKWNKKSNSPIIMTLINEINNETIVLKDDYNEYSTQGISITNKYNEFIIKASENSVINNMRLKVDFKLKYNEYNYYPELSNDSISGLSEEFGFDIYKKTSPFDEYILIGSQEEFEDMVEGRYYQLANDITLSNYTPINTAIGGLNGDGYTITFDTTQDPETKQILTPFNESQLVLDYISNSMYIGLFGVLPENSVIENLQVNYKDVSINLNSNSAIQEQHTNNIYFGGIAGQNLGVITNVKVKGSFSLASQYVSADRIDFGGIAAINGSIDSKNVATISGSSVELEMSSIALIGGVSGTNYGKITNTCFTGKISSNTAKNQYVAEVVTAGFVVENLSSGYISLSYVSCGLVANENNIHSVGRTAGFVLNNAGTINNCYINQTAIASQGNIGGFVYQSSGDISNSYAYASLGSSLFYNEFIYLTQNIGNISNCYIVTDSSINIYINGLYKIGTSQLINQDKYSGFVFANTLYGIWSMNSNGPELLNSGFNPNKNEYNDIYNIYDVETYEGYFATNSNVIEGKTFRFVRDIDFEKQGLTSNPSTFNKILKASIEGNDMALINYNIYKVGDAENIGLFASIENLGLGVYVRNLILKPSSIRATNSNAVGALAGMIDGVNIYNITIDNPNLLILGKNAVGGLSGVIKGSFEISGITSNVSSFASYTNNSTEQYNLYTGKNVTGSTLLDNITEVSYAGSVAGIVDGYNNISKVSNPRSMDLYYTISNINVNSELVLIGETVGGAFGLVGERTAVKNMNYNLSSGTIYKGVYISGGLVGENRGIIQNSNIYAYEYQNGIKARINTASCFNGFALVNGGIVGLNIGGLINKCTSDIDVCTNINLSTSGGIIGRNIEGSVYNCEILGTVEAFFAGGVVGTDYSYKTIVNQRSGFGTATIITTNVYKNIQHGVEYNSNCLVDNDVYEVNTLYKDIKLSDKYIRNFIAKNKNVYNFNALYMDNTNNHLVNATSLSGLVVGLSDSNYISNIQTNIDDNDETYIYRDKLIIGLTKGISKDTRTKYNLNYGEKTQIISPLANIVATNLEYGNIGFMLLYLVAYEGASYDRWSSTLGYSQSFVVVTPTALTEYVDAQN